MSKTVFAVLLGIAYGAPNGSNPILLADECDGWRHSTCGGLWFAAMESGVWNKNYQYKCPNGFRWATTLEVISQISSSKKCTSTSQYANKCGWNGLKYDESFLINIEREMFRARDSVSTHYYRSASDGDNSQVEFQSDSASRFAGILCVKDFVGIYRLKQTGTCDYIKSMAECNAASRILQLSSTPAKDDTNSNGVSFDPPYCYYELMTLKYNAGSNIGVCTEYDKCVCRGKKTTTPKPLIYTPGATFNFFGVGVCADNRTETITELSSYSKDLTHFQCAEVCATDNYCTGFSWKNNNCMQHSPVRNGLKFTHLSWWWNGEMGTHIVGLINEPSYSCYRKEQPINGIWSDWGPCDQTCLGGNRQRSCTNPAPANGGLFCAGGLPVSTKPCNTDIPCGSCNAWIRTDLGKCSQSSGNRKVYTSLKLYQCKKRCLDFSDCVAYSFSTEECIIIHGECDYVPSRLPKGTSFHLCVSNSLKNWGYVEVYCDSRFDG